MLRGRRRRERERYAMRRETSGEFRIAREGGKEERRNLKREGMKVESWLELSRETEKEIRRYI